MSARSEETSWLGEALKEEIEEELAARDFSAFSADVLAKIDAEVEASLGEPLPGMQALREEIDEAVEDRRLHWSAFTQGVLRDIRQEAQAEARQPLADRAVAELRRDVETELERAEPQFERRFQREVLRKIDAPPASLLDRVRAFFDGHLEGWRSGLGLIGAATAIFLLIIAAPRLENPPNQVVRPAPDRGTVVVREVSFDGRVMVIEGEGVTFVYLSDS